MSSDLHHHQPTCDRPSQTILRVIAASLAGSSRSFFFKRADSHRLVPPCMTRTRRETCSGTANADQLAGGNVSPSYASFKWRLSIVTRAARLVAVSN